jgi:hypothetical protein
MRKRSRANFDTVGVAPTLVSFTEATSNERPATCAKESALTALLLTVAAAQEDRGDVSAPIKTFVTYF